MGINIQVGISMEDIFKNPTETLYTILEDDLYTIIYDNREILSLIYNVFSKLKPYEDDILSKEQTLEILKCCTESLDKHNSNNIYNLCENHNIDKSIIDFYKRPSMLVKLLYKKINPSLH